MSGQAQVDYTALAKQAGATDSTPAQSSGGVDYTALAQQAGATSSVPASTSQSPSLLDSANAFVSPQAGDSVITQIGKGMGRIAMSVPNLLHTAVVPPQTPEEVAVHASGGQAALALKRLLYDPSANAYQTIDSTANATRQKIQAAQASGIITQDHAADALSRLDKYIVAGKALASLPIIGPWAFNEGKQIDEGKLGTAGALTDVAGMVAPAVLTGGSGGAAESAAEEGGEAAADAATHVYNPATKTITPIEQVAAKNAARAPISEGAAAVTETEAPTVGSVQPQLHQGVRNFVNDTAKANGLDPIPDSVPVTDAAQQLADALETRSKATFNQVEEITGVNPTTLKEQMAARADQITEAVASGDMEKAGNLQQLQLATENQATKAFQDAKAQGVDVEQARSDWNASTRADELSSAVRGSKANTSTLKNPVLDPNKLAPRLQKLAESQPGGRPPKLFQLGGEQSATNLVEAAEQGRGAIQNFEPTTATGQQALAEILKPNTGSGYAGMGQLRSILGFKPTTNWIRAFSDLSKLSSEELAARFGEDASQAVSYVKRQAAWQVGKAVAKGATLLTIGKALGISPTILHAAVGQ